MNSRKRSLEELQNLVRNKGKKFVSLDEGAELYSLGLHSFRDLAEEAGAIYKIRRRVLVNTEIIDEHMELFHENQA